MSKLHMFYSIIIVTAAIVALAHIASASAIEGMAACQVKHSYDTCFSAIYN